MRYSIDPYIFECVESLYPHVSHATVRQATQKLIESYQRSHSASLTFPEDFFAYLIYRFPATAGVASYVFEEIQRKIPDFQPQSLLDVGAGPGSASYSAKILFPSIKTFTLVEKLQGFIESAQKILPDVRILQKTIEESTETAECVVASYVLSELARATFDSTVAKLYKNATKCLVLIEPGSRNGFGNIIRARDILLKEGAHIIGPCPHREKCPLEAINDWCHFSVRIERSKLHKFVKEGSLGYEDEKFSYLVVTKEQVMLPSYDRIIFPPKKKGGHVIFQLCSRSGSLEERIIARRHGALYTHSKKLEWGDSLLKDHHEN